MAQRKTLDFLPAIFRTDANNKFLSATLDQLMSEPNLVTLNGFVGREFAPTHQPKDSYITENTAERQHYQLEPSIVIKNDEGNIDFFSSYTDLLNKIKYYGGDTSNHSRLFENEYYSFDPMVSLDKFVNFTEYYWLANGPDSVAVSTNGVSLTETYTVTRDLVHNCYTYVTAAGKKTDSIVLARGGTYKFIVNQPGIPFWIQSELGLDGKNNISPNISTRDILGVSNNGTDAGEVLFNVPAEQAQDQYVNMPILAEVDYALPLAYADIHNTLVSTFTDNHPAFQGTLGNLSGKTVIFVNQDQLTNATDSAWTAPTIIDANGSSVNTFDAGTLIPFANRYNIWKIALADDGLGNDVIKLVPDITVPVDNKTFIISGDPFAGTEFYKDAVGFLLQVPPITSALNTLYVQDGALSVVQSELSIVDFNNWVIDVNADISGKERYTSANGIAFTNGLKITFGADVTPAKYQNKTFYVEGVGDSIRLVGEIKLVSPEAYITEQNINYPNSVFPEYLTINRANENCNAWSRNNRWTHIDVINKTAAYNNTVPIVDQKTRATRPILEFDRNIQLFNEGRIAKDPVEVIDDEIINAFNLLEGKVVDYAFGVTLFDGMRVIFAADEDPLVRNKIYNITLEQYNLDPQGLPTGDFHVKLTVADDSDVAKYDSVVVTQGKFKGTQWWFDSTEWVQSQQKTQAQQAPLFDIVDKNNASISKIANSSFVGTKIFGFKTNSTGINDSVLGFPLSYRNFNTQGDIEFHNYYDSDTYNYTIGSTLIKNALVSDGYIAQVDNNVLTRRNIWQPVIEPSKQFQLISYTYDTTTEFPVDIVADDAISVPYLHVYVNNVELQPIEYTLTDTLLTVLVSLVKGDKIDIIVYSSNVSDLGFFQVPRNLDLNAQNINLTDLTSGQIRNHLTALGTNTSLITGNLLASSNLRDIKIRNQGGNILQHSAPVPYSSIFLLDDTANFNDAMAFAQREYTRYKNKFMELAVSLPGLDPLDPAHSVNLILQSMNAIKTDKFPWYHSDMIPYGSPTVSTSYTIFDPLTKSYEISKVYDAVTLSNKSVLVYLNDEQLIKNTDYVFDTGRPGVTFTDNITLVLDDVVRFDEYDNTDANFIPETPSKLGLYPKFIPMIYTDSSYRTPITVIRGHDGSITPAYSDFRDQYLLEVEKRIYNNIKIETTDTADELLYLVKPGKFRKTDYNNNTITNILSKKFLEWIGDNRIDFATNDTFNSSDPFTWNYSRFVDRISNEALPGSWKACYEYYYDTIRPNEAPWEMLGFADEPIWWKANYGPAPYTSGNTILWQDLEDGRILAGNRAGIDTRFARPGLLNAIPVDINGFVVPPAAILTASFNASSAATAWAIGSQGPAEAAWRASSEFPYAYQQALALAKPGRYFGSLMDLSRVNRDAELGQVVNAVGHHITQDKLVVHGLDPNTNEVVRSAGYINWISDYLISLGISPYTKISGAITKYSVNLAYKLGGFTDNKLVKVLAEQNSPASTNSSVIIPNENYKIHLTKSAPIDRLIYSSVLVEKTTNGYSVRGYDLTNPYFNIIPSIVNANAYKITVLDSEATVYNDFQQYRINVPYGHEFNTQQQLADFLISYERYLQAQGFVFNDFDETLEQARDWKLSVKEFLYWAQQGWKPGSIIVLSPVVDSLTVNTVGAITDGLSNSQYSSRILDQNFKLLRNDKFNVLRSAEATRIQLDGGDTVIGYAEFDLVQYEHAMIFDNTTVFNDIIYKPELGNRQYRLKLVGQKTGEWNGSLYAPGFIYNSGEVNAWSPSLDYLKGDLVKFKNNLYVALVANIASAEFEFKNWKQINSTDVKTGLLPNFSTISSRAESYYDAYGEFSSTDELKFSHGLIGFKPRQYLDDVGIDETSQIEFYKGFIKQKGTANAINALTDATFNNLQSTLTFSEEWAIRSGEYGALDINPYVEVALNEQAFSVNPALAEFVGDMNNNEANGNTIFKKTDLYKVTDQYTGNIATTRSDFSNYSNDMISAGYVHLSDIDTTIFDLANFTDFNNQLSKIGSGYTIWCAKDFTQDWNVFRVSETNVDVISVENTLNQRITFTTNTQHHLNLNDIFLVKNFDAVYDGFYKVESVPTLTKILVTAINDTSNLSSISGSGILFSMDSVRFAYMEDARNYTPAHGWREGEKIWIDIDAATSTYQGQPINTVSNTWKVYEKTKPWKLAQTVNKSIAEYSSTSKFGASVKIDPLENLIVVGDPVANTTGVVSTFARSSSDGFVQGFTLLPDANNTLGYGTSVAASTSYIAVGAPASAAGDGHVYTYSKAGLGATFARDQIIIGATGDQAGTSVAYDNDGKWLYIGAPANDIVYAYGLVENIDYKIQVTPVNAINTITLSAVINDNAITMSGPITAPVGSIVTQTGSAFSSTVTIDLVNGTALGVVNLTSLTVGSGSIIIDGVNTGFFPTATTTTPATIAVGSTVSQIGSPFQSTVTADATSSTAMRVVVLTNITVGSGNLIVNGIETVVHPTAINSNSNSVNTIELSHEVTSVVVTTPGTNYSQGASVEVAPSTQFGGSTATGDTFINPTTGAITAVILNTTGAYITTPAVSIAKPASVVIASANMTISSANIFVPDTTGIHSGMYVSGTGFNPSTKVDTVFDSNLISVTLANTAPVSGNVTISDNGTGFVGSVTEGPSLDPEALLITSSTRTFLPGIDYTVAGSTVSFTNYLPIGDIAIAQKPYYKLIDTLSGPAGSEFGHTIDTGSDGTHIAIGAPNDIVTGLASAGSVYVYERRAEAFTATGGSDYTTSDTLGTITRVKINGVATTNYFVVGTHIIRFTTLPAVGVRIEVETNSFALIEQVTGTTPQAGARSGSALTICSNNCAVYIGAPSYDKDTETNTGAVVKFHNRGRLYGTNIGTIVNPTFTIGHSLRIDNFEVVATGTTLDTLVNDINTANILGITAANENGLLRITSSRTKTKNLMQLSSGVGTILSDAGLHVYAQMQVIVNPYDTPSEFFGSSVVLADNAYKLVIGSDKGTTRLFTTYDNNITTIDNETTLFFSTVYNSGSVYVYELYDDPRDAVEHPGRYAFAQQLNPGGVDANGQPINELNTGDQFGYAVDVVGKEIVVTAPSDDTQLTDAGSIYLFNNPTNQRGWSLLRNEEPSVDIESVSRIYLYDKVSQTIKTNLEILDPNKGKILGLAEQEISYKTEYDPAIYNKGIEDANNVNFNVYWSSTQVGQVWWDLSAVRFIDYEQGTNDYRGANWGKIFPGSTVEILEWVESDVLPSEYVNNGYNGIPKYEDNSAYVEVTTIGDLNNKIINTYYYWVKEKTEVNTTLNKTRNITSKTIKDLIENPKSQGIPYAAIIAPNALLTYNLSHLLSASDTIAHIDYEMSLNNSIIHSEYDLIQQGQVDSFVIPAKIKEKIIDSLAGIDSRGRVIPDPTLSDADKYGISIRPRQSIFNDRFAALAAVVAFINNALIALPVAKTVDLHGMLSEQPEPAHSSVDLVLATDVDLSYVATGNLPTDYTVLVQQDTVEDNLWTIYKLTAEKTWVLMQTQGFKSDLYWNYIDWYIPGFDTNKRINYVVDTLVDALKLPYAPGNLIKINNAQAGGWELLEVDATGNFTTIGLNNGTIQLSESLLIGKNSRLGFDNQGFAEDRMDQNPSQETREIIRSVIDDIFIEELVAEKNNIFFAIVNYIFTEQTSVDWIFKTSFINVQHNIRELMKTTNYIKDNHTYYQDYINEVKPYSANIREYLLKYSANDRYNSATTDFDLPPYYDTGTKLFRSPNGELTKDAQILATGYDGTTLINDRYPEWYANRKLAVDHIEIVNGGTGYVTPPTITISGGETTATATAVIDGDTGELLSIELTSPGSGFTETPLVDINGSATIHATAAARLASNVIRSVSTTMLFDRYAYSSKVTPWAANTQYLAGDIISYNNQGYTVNANISVSSTFIPEQYTAWLPSTDANSNTIVSSGAADRIITYYNPGSLMPQVEEISFQLTTTTTITTASTRIYVNTVKNIHSGMRITSGNAVLATITDVVLDVANGNQYIDVSRAQTLDSGTTLNATYYNISQLLRGIEYPGAKITGATFNQTPSFDGEYDVTVYDNVQYNSDGVALISNASLDTIIRSTYTNTLLGTRPEDINIEGGAYVDTFSSHAPEELVPGIVFDSLNIAIYTKDSANTVVWGYRIFHDMLQDPIYTRIADSSTTILAQDLHLTDTVIYVEDASKLAEPGTVAAEPGVIFVNGERITYFTRDLVLNTLGQIRRGTAGTGAPLVHPAGTSATDGGLDQQLINTVSGTRLANATTILNPTTSTITATDGTGLEGSTQITANFIKNEPSAYLGNNILTVETAVNIYNIALSTEDGQILIIEA